MSEPKNYRKFLNALEAGGTAYVTFVVEHNKSGYISATFTIKDCSGEATLEFYVPKGVRKGKPHIENSNAKIAILREAVDEFAEAFEAALDEREAQKKKKRKKS